MSLFYKLLGIDVPPGASSQSLELQFRGWLPWWLVLLLAVILCGGTFVLYKTERAKFGWYMRLPMACLRAMALALLLFLLCRPVLQFECTALRPREIILLIDNSQSMKQQDRRLALAERLRVAIAQGLLPPGTLLAGPTAPQEVPPDTLRDPQRADLVREVLGNSKLHLLDDLQRHWPVVPMLLGSDARPAIADPTLTTKRALTDKAVLAKFDVSQSQTALADAIHGLLQRKDGDLPAAIVVMTDGRDNGSKYSMEEAAQACANAKVPLHIYGTGSAESVRLKLRELYAQDSLFADDNVTIPVRWRADGIEKGTVSVSVTLAGKEQRKQVAIQPGLDQVTEFTFTLPKASKNLQKSELSASVQLREDASFKDEQQRPVDIIGGKVKVLYIEYAPRKEYHFLQTVLLNDRRMEPYFWLITANEKAQTGGPFLHGFPAKKDLATYDVVILGDVPADKLKKENAEALTQWVSDNRGGLVVMAGRQHMPAAYASSIEIKQLLPVEFQSIKFAVDSPGSPLAFQPQVTSAGLRTDWMMLADQPEDNFKQWKDLPGMFWYYPVTKLRPGAMPLLVHPTVKMGEEPMPLISQHYYGKGQVLFVGCEESWRWRFNTQDKVFGRFWSQLLLQMAMPHKLVANSGHVEMSVNRSTLVVGKRSTLIARLLDRNYEPYKKAKVDAVVEYLDAKPGQERFFKVALDPVPGREKAAEYETILPTHLPGRWQVKLVEPEPATFAYSVTLPALHELDEAPMAAEAMRTAASVSGGRFYQEESLHEMAASISPRETAFTMHQEVLLWGPLPFLIFTALVASEWLLRKLGNLS